MSRQAEPTVEQRELQLTFVKEHGKWNLREALYEGVTFDASDLNTSLHEYQEASTRLFVSAVDEVDKLLAKALPYAQRRGDIGSLAKGRWVVDMLWKAYVDALDVYSEDVRKDMGLGDRGQL